MFQMSERKRSQPSDKSSELLDTPDIDEQMGDQEDESPIDDSDDVSVCVCVCIYFDSFSKK